MIYGGEFASGSDMQGNGKIILDSWGSKTVILDKIRNVSDPHDEKLKIDLKGAYGTLIFENINDLDSRILKGHENINKIVLDKVNTVRSLYIYKGKVRTIEGSVNRILDRACLGGETLQNVSLSDVYSIGRGAFNLCYALKNVSVPSVVHLGFRVFGDFRSSEEYTNTITVQLPNIKYMAHQGYDGYKIRFNVGDKLEQINIKEEESLFTQKKNEIIKNCSLEQSEFFPNFFHRHGETKIKEELISSSDRLVKAEGFPYITIYSNFPLFGTVPNIADKVIISDLKYIKRAAGTYVYEHFMSNITKVKQLFIPKLEEVGDGEVFDYCPDLEFLDISSLTTIRPCVLYTYINNKKRVVENYTETGRSKFLYCMPRLKRVRCKKHIKEFYEKVYENRLDKNRDTTNKNQIVWEIVD